jgi:hypothetical protein
MRHASPCAVASRAQLSVYRYEYDHRYSVSFNRKDAGKALEKFLSSFDIPVRSYLCEWLRGRRKRGECKETRSHMC